MPTETAIPHSDLKLDTSRPFFFKDGDKWLVKTSNDIKIESAIPKEVIDITAEDRKKHHVLLFNCIIKRRLQTDISDKSINNRPAGWGDSESRVIAQTVDQTITMKGGQVMKISNKYLRIALKFT